MNAPISAIQIQTIDACNSRCIMCPHKSVDHSGAAMNAALFEGLMDQIAREVDRGRVAEELELHLYFQNEPLLDPELFARARLARQRLPRAHLVCFTNGLLLPRRTEELIASDFDLLWLSLYGHDVSSFRRITGVTVEPRQLAEMLAAMDQIERSGALSTVTSEAWVKKGNRRELYDFSSRAGFYSGRVLHQGVAGCEQGRDGWLCFRASGELVLCCMDWEHETRVGNLSEQPLDALLSSTPFAEQREQVRGQRRSPDGFICKRCEWAVPASEARTLARCPRRLVVSWAWAGQEEAILDWLVSLRTLGDYHGPVLLLDGGITSECAAAVESFGAQRAPLERKDQQLASLRPLLERRFHRHRVAVFSPELWFAGPLEPLFHQLDHVLGCLHAVQQPGRVDPSSELLRRYQGTLHPGFIAGRYRPLIERLNALDSRVAEGQAQEAALAELFDFGRDRADGYRWCCDLRDAEQSAAGWVHARHSDRWLKGSRWSEGTIREESVVGLCHRHGETPRFREAHAGLFQEALEVSGSC